MSNLREAAQQALEAMACMRDMVAHPDNLQFIDNAITALRTALSRKALDDLAEIDRELGLDDMQPDLAKVGEVGVWGEPVIDKSAAKRIAIQLGWEPKREWHGLTDDEIDEIIGYVDPHCQEEQFARAIEAKLKEKNQ